MFSSPIDEIKNRLDIVEVVGSYIKLQKAGANFRALCPFHSEKKPSFFVSPARQIWHCFGGCGRGGSIFNFVMEIEGVEFGDALRILAKKAGVELKRGSLESADLRTERQRLYEICELTTKFFEKQLEASKAGREAKKYLLKRGIRVSSLKKWRIGYAPDVWQGLSDFLNSRGYQKGEIEKAGLGLSSVRGSFYDRFRGRIIFPIFDLNSQVIGFGGRVSRREMEEKEIAKYLNTPQTLLYDKSRTLYGLDKAKVEIRKQDCCILVEGYIDLIMVVQSGSENAVATSGTALTPYQLKILKRYSNNLLTAFDMDRAGDAATKKGISLAQEQGFNIKIITMPQGSDPADISKKDKDWKDLVEGAKSITDFYFESAFSCFDPATPEGKREISKIILPQIKRIQNKIEQSHWIQELAERLEVKEEAIEAELKKIKTEPRQTDSRQIEEPPIDFGIKNSSMRKQMLEERIAHLVFKNPQNLNLVDEDHFPCFSPKIQAVLTGLKKGLNFEKQDWGEFNWLFLKSETEEMEIDPETEIRVCLREIKSLVTKDRLDEISQNIKKAEKTQDSKKVSDLTKEFNELANRFGSGSL